MLCENKPDDLTWEAFKGGDRNAYAAIYRFYYPKLFNYGLKFSKNKILVEESIQEVFTAFWFNRHKMDTVQTLGSYLFVCFRNQLTKCLRQSSRFIDAHAEEYEFDIEVSADHMMINAERMYEQRVKLNRALEKLTERQKEVIFLKFYENLSYEDIAVLLHISTKATYKLAARAIAELRKVYHEDFASSLRWLVAVLAGLNLLS